MPQTDARLRTLPGVDYRRLGTSGLQVSEIAFGNWINDTEGSAAELARAALDRGITTFDTADVYADSRSEVVLGRVLAGIRRESVEVCTKVAAPVGRGPNDRGLSRKHIMEAVDGSLRRLRTDYIDVYQAHRFDPATPLVETLKAFDDLVRRGKVLYVGVSEWTAAQITEAVAIADQMGFDRIISSQPQYNLLWRVIEEDVVPTCGREGIGQMAWSPLAQGVLTGKYVPGADLPAGSRAAGRAQSLFNSGALTHDVLARIAAVKKLVAEHDLSMAQYSLAWILRQPTVSSVIVGASVVAQLDENVSASGTTLSDDLVSQVDVLLTGVIERDGARTPAQPQDYGK